MKTVVLTFYDSSYLSYTTTYYVREEATREQAETLVHCIDDLSACVLAKYKIGDEQFDIPGYEAKMKALTYPVRGTAKWVLKYKDKRLKAGSRTIPGRDEETSLRVTSGVMGKVGKLPDLRHPKWQALLTIFKEICLSNKGIAIHESFYEGGFREEGWPPKRLKLK